LNRMKKNISVTLLVIVILSISVHYYISKTTYDKKVVKMSKFKIPQFAEDLLEYFYTDSNYFPDRFEINAFYDTTGLNSGEINTLNLKMINDYYSSKQQPLHYVRIISDGKTCGYILLSSGIDGKINNSISELDCSQFSNYAFDLYNNEDDFNYFNYVFGNSDLIYDYKNHCNCNNETVDSAYKIPLRWLDYDDEINED